jgi:hypothetical protein
MPVFRFLAAVCLLVATIALVSDATPAVYGAQPFAATTLAGHWKDLAPSSFEATRNGASEIVGPGVWESVLEPALETPTCLAFLLMAVLFGYLGRRRKTLRIFVN